MAETTTNQQRCGNWEMESKWFSEVGIGSTSGAFIMSAANEIGVGCLAIFPVLNTAKSIVLLSCCQVQMTTFKNSIDLHLPLQETQGQI